MISKGTRHSMFVFTGLALLLATGTLHSSARWVEGIADGTMQYLTGSIEPTSDGGYIVVGYRAQLGETDGWCAKLDALGNISWQYGYGTAGKADSFSDVCPLSDGTYFVTGRTASYGAGGSDVWCLHLGQTGNVIWQKTYGGASDDTGSSGRVLSDGGFIVVGTTQSFGPGSRDVWCLRLNASGNVIWQKAYGGSGWDQGGWAQETSDKGFIVGANSNSFAAPNAQTWCLKLDSSGAVEWQMGYGSYIMAWVYEIEQTSDGGYVLSAAVGGAMLDSSIVKLTPTGAVTWHTLILQASPAFPFLQDVRQTDDGGYVACGSLRVDSMGDNAWLVKLNANGNFVWQKAGGGVSHDDFYRVRPTPDGGFVFAGESVYSGTTGILVSRTNSSGDVDASCNVQNTAIVPTYPSLAATPTAAATVDTAITGVDSSVVPSPVLGVMSPFCSSPAAPDLAGSWSNVGLRGAKLRGTFKCANNGAAAAGPFTVKVYFSKRKGTRKATLVKTQNVPGLVAFGTYSFKVMAKPGDKHKYVIADIDSGKAVAEDDETNNTIAYKFR